MSPLGAAFAISTHYISSIPHHTHPVLDIEMLGSTVSFHIFLEVLDWGSGEGCICMWTLDQKLYCNTFA